MDVCIIGKLDLTATRDTTVWLTGTRAKCEIPMDDQALESTGGYQEVEYVRGANAVQFYRGQERTALTFSVLRQFANIALAELWMEDHRRTTPKSGRVECWSVYGGVLGGKRMIPNAQLTMSFRQMGCSITTTYRIAGGGMNVL